MKETAAQIIRPWQKEEAQFFCSKCGADRYCDCNAHAVEKLAAKQEQERLRARAYRERNKTSRDAPVENKKRI